MRRVFLGKGWHWLMLIALGAVLWWMGHGQLQTRDYPLFLGVLIGLTVAMVLAIVAAYRHGQRITREPFDEAPAERDQ